MLVKIEPNSLVELVEDLTVTENGKVRVYKKGSQFVYIGPWTPVRATSELLGNGDTRICAVPNGIFKAIVPPPSPE